MPRRKQTKRTTDKRHESKGEMFRIIRVASGMSRQEVADRLKVSNQQVYTWETGRAPVPRKKIIGLKQLIKSGESMDVNALMSIAAMIDFKSSLERYEN